VIVVAPVNGGRACWEQARPLLAGPVTPPLLLPDRRARQAAEILRAELLRPCLRHEVVAQVVEILGGFDE